MDNSEAVTVPGMICDEGGRGADRTENSRIKNSNIKSGIDVSEKKEKLWSKNFFLLWQGQLVSVLGDAVYSLALGFWVMAKTGSTALMGTLMAVSMIPSVVISPFAGVIVDRVDRKRLLIVSDILRGLAVVLLAISAYQQTMQIWMVFIVGVLLGVGGAFFSPAVNSSIPDLVPQSKLVSANSVMGMLNTGAQIIGSSAGGFLLQILGAPFLFLFNGLSFIFSSILTLFMKIPKIEHKSEQHFLADMKEGYTFIWRFKALRYLLFIAAGINFIFFIAMVLFLPLFQQSKNLGAGKYGLVMAFFTGGMFLAMAAMSLIRIPAGKRMPIFMAASFLMAVFFAIFALADNFVIMSVMILGGGFAMAIVNVFVNSTIQLTVPQEIRGKVFSLVTVVCMSLTPFAMAIGGVLGEIFPLRAVIFTCFVVTMVGFIPCAFIKSLKKFINFDPEKDTLEEIMK